MEYIERAIWLGAIACVSMILITGGLYLIPPKFEHIFVAVRIFPPFLVYR